MDREQGEAGQGGVRAPVTGADARAAAAVEDADVVTASDDYARRFAGAVGAWFLAEQARITRELLADLPRGARVLDVGGGHAQLTPLLVERGFEVVVLGSGPGADRQLAPFLARGQVRFETGNLVALPYAGGSFDAALSFRLLPHVTAWRGLVVELCRVACRCVVVDYPSTRSINALADRFFGLKRQIEGNTRPFASFRPGEIDSAFAAAGFRVATARPQFLLPMVLHRTLRSAAMARALEAPGRVLGFTQVLGSPIIVRAEPATG